jgi:hypothetical protein
MLGLLTDGAKGEMLLLLLLIVVLFLCYSAHVVLFDCLTVTVLNYLKTDSLLIVRTVPLYGGLASSSSYLMPTTAKYLLLQHAV